jgi:hypothetical protein
MRNGIKIVVRSTVAEQPLKVSNAGGCDTERVEDGRLVKPVMAA